MLAGRTVLVTGATSGIGAVTARALAKQGAKVIITARAKAKAETTLAAIRARVEDADISYLLCDFASQQQIRDLAAAFKARYDRLDVLVNNAGAVFSSRQETEDGIEQTFAVNHLGYFLLTQLLLDMLKASAPSRIINVASAAHESVSEIDFDDIGFENGYGIMKAYSRSKMANIMFAYELARRLEGTGVTINALHPGFVATNIGANTVPVVGSLIKKIVNVFAKNAETGAETSIYLALSSEVEGVTAKYFANCKEVPSNSYSYNEAAQKKLWALSKELTGLTRA